MAGAVSRPARTHALSRSVDTVALRTEVENSWLASHSFAARMNEGETIELRAGGFTKTCIKKGNGVRPEDGNLCTMNYTGKLDDGTVFDSSVGKAPFKFHLGLMEVIKGWDIAVATMTVGEKALVHIPPSYAYGDRGIGPIPPKAELTFEIELLEVRDDTCDKVKRSVGGLIIFLILLATILWYNNMLG